MDLHEKLEGKRLKDGSIVEVSVGVVCSCMPTCSILFRHHLPLFIRFKSYLVSKVRIFTAQFATGSRGSGGSSSWRFFSLGGSKKSIDGQQPDPEKGQGGRVGMRKLPVLPKGIHKMWTARSFILGSKKDMTVDYTENSTTLSTIDYP